VNKLYVSFNEGCTVVEYRGSVIHYSTLIERTIDSIIVEHFCRDTKQVEFIHVLLGNEFFLGKKIDMVWFIIENYSKRMLTLFPEIYDLLTEFKNNRNVAAHRYFDENAPENKDLFKLHLQHYKTERNKTKIKNIPIDLKLVLKNMIGVTKALEHLLWDVRQRNQKDKTLYEIEVLKKHLDNETA